MSTMKCSRSCSGNHTGRSIARRAAAGIGSTALALLGACAASGGSARARIDPACDHGPRIPAFDVEHYALDLELLPATRALRGTCTVRLYAREAPLAAVELDLVGLRVEGVRDGAGRALRFEQRDGTLAIALAEPLAPRDYVELAIDYGGAPKRGLWFVRDEDGVPTQVFTQGECEDARGWFPCWDAPCERATSEIRVTLPAGWTSIAAGERFESTTLADGRVVERWRMSAPHPSYLETLVAGRFAVSAADWNGIPLAYVVEPRFEASAARTFACTPQALAFLSEIAGRLYPYAKYSQACVDDFPFGGMENISATTLTDSVLTDERGARDSDPSGLVVHEAAHQWFGDLLTCRDWAHVWLNESFATYMSQLYVERTRGAEEFESSMRDVRESYLAGDVGAARRPIVYGVYKEPLDLFFGGQVYPGGASRLHLLRFELGDDAFFRGIRGYVADNAGRSVVTEDLERALEHASGRDLAPFFEQWFLRPGFPELEVRSTWDESARAVRVVLEQKQRAERGTPAVFVFPAEIEIAEESGTRVERVEVNRGRQELELACLTRPKWVRFDPHGWLPARVNEKRSVREWLALADAGNALGRREAVDALGRALLLHPTAEVEDLLVAALVHRLLEDPIPTARAEAATALATSHRSDARAALVRSAELDGTASVRVAALNALARRGRDAELARLAERAFDEGFSWRTMGAAAALRCAADPASAHEWLESKLTAESPHGVLRAELVTTLASVAGARADEELVRRAVDESEESSVRAAAVRGLGRNGVASASVRAVLTELLATRECRLRPAVIEALGRLHDPRAVPALIAAHEDARDPRERRAIEAVLAERWAAP